MPTRPTKGDHGTRDSGSSGRGGQKAVTGSAVDPDVAEARRRVEEEAADQGDEPTP
ncbi:MAG: hypothetical protein KY443_04515 [Actinobacteria bacterium]|nr:hypothetical protein [Actinomycetota bacterium]